MKKRGFSYSYANEKETSILGENQGCPLPVTRESVVQLSFKPAVLSLAPAMKGLNPKIRFVTVEFVQGTPIRAFDMTGHV